MAEDVVFLKTSIQCRNMTESVVYVEALNAEHGGGYAI
jgi:hypothetical protein